MAVVKLIVLSLVDICIVSDVVVGRWLAMWLLILRLALSRRLWRWPMVLLRQPVPFHMVDRRSDRGQPDHSWSRWKPPEWRERPVSAWRTSPVRDCRAAPTIRWPVHVRSRLTAVKVRSCSQRELLLHRPLMFNRLTSRHSDRPHHVPPQGRRRPAISMRR